MERREVRTNIFKILFQIEARKQEDKDEIFNIYCEENGITKNRDVRLIKERVEDIVTHLQEIDDVIEKYSNGWKINRLGKAELAILRVSIYEVLFDETIPNPVAANEAVELAKVYAEEKAPSFINGILAQVIAAKEA